MRCAQALQVALALLVRAAACPGQDPTVVRTGSITDGRLTEVSGIVPVAGRPRHYWAHNDSGAQARLYVLRDDGIVLAELPVAGAAATDWEDIAAAPAAQPGRRWLYVGDVGNNDGRRKELIVYRLLEPVLTDAALLEAGSATRVLPEEPATALRFRYPGASVDCEAIAVEPGTRAIYLLSKELAGCRLFRLRGDAEAPAAQVAEELGELPGTLLATAADISPSGDRLLVRTYLSLTEHPVPAGQPFAAVLGAPASKVPRSLLEIQGEAACYDEDGWSVLTVDELKPSSIHRTVRAAPAPSPARVLASRTRPTPLSPAEALASFQVTPGMRVELAACEPEVVDPVAVVFDEEGRLLVVEMGDYPLGPQPGEEPRGRIRRLTDADGDGRFERAATFASGLRFATGAQPWRGGLFVTTQRQILYLADDDRDGREDRRQVLFDGFKDENSQLLPNHPTLGLDGWIHVANGLRAGDIWRGAPHGPPTLSLRGRDLRFLPDDPGRAEPVAGMSQFGLAFDDEGERFLCWNRGHLQHVVIEDRYAARNPVLALETSVADVPEHGAAGRIYPLTSNWTTSYLHAGTFTACSGVTIYRGDLLSAARGDAFVCESPGNLVHRDRLRSTGATFTGTRVEPERESEFLRSRDEWFRPVNLAVGPDGALYVVDMYRAVIEHPHWVPAEEQDRPDLLLGNDCGRIWRIVPDGSRSPAVPGRSLDQLSAAEVVQALESPNGWRRDTAQRLLLERREPETRGPLSTLAACNDAAPLARLHALWTLEALGWLEGTTLLGALRDPDPRVRKAAVRLAESRLEQDVELRAAVARTALDDDAAVRFQAALTCGSLPAAEAVEPLAYLASRDAADRWFRTALLTAPPRTAALLLGRLVASERDVGAAELDLGRELAAIVGASEPPEVAARILAGACARERGVAPPFERALLVGLDRGLSRAGRTLLSLGEAPGAPAGLNDRLTQCLLQALREAEREESTAAERVAALGLAARLPWEQAQGPLVRLIVAAAPPEVAAAAARALLASGAAQAWSVLLERWDRLPPAARRAAVDDLLARGDLRPRLLDALEDGRLPHSELDPAQWARLAKEGDEAQRRRAAALDTGAAARQEVLATYRAALGLAGDLERGRAAFARRCATCHRVAGVGVDVGPDIADARDKSPETLLQDIIDPNRAIDGRYVAYTLATRDGRVSSGILTSETASALTLALPEGRLETALRSEIEAIASSGLSLMPEGLERDLSLQDVADLIFFLKRWRYDLEARR